MIEILADKNNAKEWDYVLDAITNKLWIRWDADAIQKLTDLGVRFSIIPHPTDSTKIKIIKILKK